jgi:RhtB (resistance to homoserine/threonine) family protein
MATASILVGILGALLIGAMSPGPSFVLVSRTAVTSSRPAGLAAAVGMGLGGAVFGSLALLGLSALLAKVHWLYVFLKLLGGAYLIYLAVMIWRSAPKPLAAPGDQISSSGKNLYKPFLSALLVQLSNPKTAVVYGSIFAAFLPTRPELWLLLILPPLIFAIETFWYAVVALVFSAKRPHAMYLRSKTWVDRAASLVMGILGYRLIADSVASSQAMDMANAFSSEF